MVTYYYKLPSNEVFKELMQLAQSNGWQTSGVGKRKEGIRDIKVDEEYLEIDNGWTYLYEKSSVEGTKISLKEARKILSQKIEWIKHFAITKKEDGLQIGCTFFPQKALEKIYDRFTDEPIIVNESPVKFEQEETGEGIKKYVRYGSRFYEKDIKKLAKLAGIGE